MKLQAFGYVVVDESGWAASRAESSWSRTSDTPAVYQTHRAAAAKCTRLSGKKNKKFTVKRAYLAMTNENAGNLDDELLARETENH